MNKIVLLSLLLTCVAFADLCPKCKDMMVISSIGTCKTCRGMTSSGAYKLCKKCSKKAGKCQLCQKAMKAASQDKVRALKLDTKSDGKTVKAALNELITIELVSNPSTGYDWSAVAQAKDSILKLKSKIHRPARVRRAGAPGTTVVTYQVVKSGEGKISLAYCRPWEKDAKPAKTFNVTIKAK